MKAQARIRLIVAEHLAADVPRVGTHARQPLHAQPLSVGVGVAVDADEYK